MVLTQREGVSRGLRTAARAGIAIAALVLGGAFIVSCGSLGSARPAEGASAKVALVPDPAVVSGTFDNGLAWKILRNGEPKNRIALRLAVNAGSVLEDDDQKGIAHLVEHMAFNGSEHFEKNELIEYFESIGMQFGPEVNAYTSFDETVYMLEIPADDPEILAKSLLVLRDWACALSFDPVELDKERGVVTEEWRLGRGAQGRASDAEFPFIFEGSLYAERLPIGDMEIVKSISLDRVVDFYRSWYRPELMTVTIVGDADPAVLQAALADSMGTIPKSSGKPKRPVPAGPESRKPGVLVFRDPEIQYATVEILESSAAKPFRTEGDYRDRLIQGIAGAAFNSRLQEKTLVADPVMLGAGAGLQRFSRPTDFAYLVAVPQPGRFTDGLKQLMEEWLRFREFGITAPELDRAKQNILDSAKQAWLDREKIDSSAISGALVNEALYGDVKVSPDDDLRLTEALVGGIAAEEVNAVLRKWFTERGTALVVTAPETASDIPADAELLDFWQNWKPETALVAYAENALDRPLFDAVLAAPAAGSAEDGIVSERALTEAGLVEWKLKNGATVLALPTDFKNNEVLFSAWSKGGSSLFSDGDFPSGVLSVSYAQMSGLNGFNATDVQKKLSGMTVGANPWLGNAYEGLSGSSSVKDLEALFQLSSLWFNRPYFSPDAWSSLKAQLDTLSASRGNDPGELFADLKTRLLYGSDIRHSNLTPEFVSQVDAAKAQTLYLGRFANAGDFTFVFVGSFDTETLKRFAATYLAVLPSSGGREDGVSRTIPFPKGIVTDSLRKGIDPKSRVFMAFGGSATVSGNDRELYESVCSLLEIRLREVVREDMSGSYGVGVRGTLVDYPEAFYETDIEFGCEPGREDELSAVVLEQIRWMQSAPVPEQYVTKLRETWKRTQEEGMRDNGYWLSKIVNYGMEGRSFAALGDVDGVASELTGENLQRLARRWFDEKNYVKAYLQPEK